MDIFHDVVFWIFTVRNHIPILCHALFTYCGARDVHLLSVTNQYHAPARTHTDCLLSFCPIFLCLSPSFILCSIASLPHFIPRCQSHSLLSLGRSLRLAVDSTGVLHSLCIVRRHFGLVDSILSTVYFGLYARGRLGVTHPQCNLA